MQTPNKRDKQSLEKFLHQAEVLFDGRTYKLTPEERLQIEDALEAAFWDAKQRNKRKKDRKQS